MKVLGDSILSLKSKNIEAFRELSVKREELLLKEKDLDFCKRKLKENHKIQDEREEAFNLKELHYLQQIKQIDDDLINVLNSTSWKITKPVRNLLDILKK